MKKLISVVLCCIMCISICPFSYAFESQDEKESINSSSIDDIYNKLGETGYVLVENGVSRSITYDEYVSLLNSTEDESDTSDNTSPMNTDSTISIQSDNSFLLNSDSTSLIQSTIPSFYYTYTPTNSTPKYSSSYRVSGIMGCSGLDSLSATFTYTFSRSVTNSGGVTLTSSIKNTIFSGVSATYSYASSATSSTSVSICGTYVPTGKYKYCAVVFTPKLHHVTGNLKYYQVYNGITTLLYTYSNVTVDYPYSSSSSSSILDGIYEFMESNSTSAFPDLG